MSDKEIQPQRPLIFISHLHSDRDVASALREWLEKWSMGAIDVYQTSAAGNVPQLGNLNERLKEKLWEAQSVALMYTNADHDWSYCMWECGVATDPKKPDTKVIPFQCGKDIPPPFSDSIRVNIHDKVSIHNFTAALLTSTEFFPRYGKAVAPNLNSKSKQVKEAAEELFSKLTNVCPLREAEPSEEWPALAYIQLELDLSSAEQINQSSRRERSSKAAKIIAEGCTIRHSDYVAAGLFGLARINPGMTLDKLGSIWKDKHPQLGLEWLESIKEQIVLASSWEFPRTDLELLEGDDGKLYAPQLTWVRKTPALNCIRFDLQFFPVGSPDEDGRAITLTLERKNGPVSEPDG